MTIFTERQFVLFKYWLPALLSGVLAWIIFLIADTPVVRASGLALVIVGLALALRRMGAVLSVIGSLTLAVSPTFWSQMGGSEGDPATIIIAIAAAGAGALIALMVSQRPSIAPGVGIVIFTIFFWSQIGTPQSLRLTGFVVSWLLFLMVDMLLLTNPRPEDGTPPPILQLKSISEKDGTAVQPYHVPGILLLFAIGVMNDPLLILLSPSIVLSLWLSGIRLAKIYQVIVLVIIAIGVRGVITDYFMTQGHWIALGDWRNARNWIEMVKFVIEQFTIAGIAMGVLGLARLSRWYPPLGIVTMTGYACYIFFGLVYSGPRRDVLMMPLLIIQIVWITYAVFTLSEWLRKSFPGQSGWLPYGAMALYTLLPILILSGHS